MKAYNHENRNEQTNVQEDINEDQNINKRHQPSSNKKPWYNQGWLWLIVTIVAMGTFFFLFQNLTDQIGQLTEATQEQTKALETQNNILAGMKEKMDDMIREFNQMTTQIVNAMQNMKNA